MNLLLALEQTNGINSFAQFITILGGSGIILVLFIVLFSIFSPAVIIANAIKKAALIRSLPQHLKVVIEEDDLFKLEHGVVVYKKYYDKELDRYVTPHGVYEPLYSSSYFNDHHVSAFIYKK